MLLVITHLVWLLHVTLASTIKSSDRQLGPPAFPPDGVVHDYDENNNNENFNPGNSQSGSRNFGYSRNLPPPPPPPPPPPRSAWKWWRYHALSDKEILDHLLHHQRYDRRERPPFDGTLQVNVSLNIISINWSEKSKYEIELVLHQEWFDARLIHESRPGGAGIFLNGIHHHRDLWLPDTYFMDTHDPAPENLISPARMALQIYANGTVFYILRRHLDLDCQGERSFYPFDILECTFAVESASHPRNEVDLVWTSTLLSSLTSPLTLAKTSRRQKVTTIRNLQTIACSDQQTWRGNFSCLQITFQMERDRSQMWSKVYCTDLVLSLIVVTSFGLGAALTPRLLVVFSILMAYLVLTTADLRELDTSDGDEWSALDVWRNATLAFIYSAFLEIILVTAFSSKFGSRRVESSTRHQLSNVSHSISSNVVGCGTIIQGKCDCGHYTSVDGSHQNVSLLLEGGDFCLRCSTASGIRSLDLGETPIEDRSHFQNPFERRDNFKHLSSPNSGSSTKKIPSTRKNFSGILDKIFGAIYSLTYFTFVIVYFCKYLD